MRGMQRAAQKSFREENEILKSLLAKQYDEIAKRDAIIRKLLEDIRLARHRLYGASSEQVPGQGTLFDEAEVLGIHSCDQVAEKLLRDRRETRDARH